MKSRTSSPLLSFLLGCAYLAAPLLHAQPPSGSSRVSAPVQTRSTAELPPAPEPQVLRKEAEEIVFLAAQNQAPVPNTPTPSTSQSQQAPPAPSLGDLGFSTQQTQGDPKLQAMLDRRTHMLKVHQRLGLITTIPMAAALITGPMVKVEGKDGQPIKVPSQANLDFHAALGSTTAAMYFTTAYYAIFAPRVPGTKHRGPIRLHEALAFIHGPGMIATPILGAMAFNQENSGQRVHGIASAHGAVAATTVLAYGAAMLAVSWPLRFSGHSSKTKDAASVDGTLPLAPSAVSANLAQN